MTEFPLTSGSGPIGITTGPDGNVWFTQFEGDRIGRITPAGAVTEFSQGITAGARPQAIVAGVDGNLWFTELMGNRVGRITPTGVVTEFAGAIPPGSRPSGITVGADGNLWVAKSAGLGFLRVTALGGPTVAIVNLPPFSQSRSPLTVVNGPDGSMWFTEDNLSSRVGDVDVENSVTEFEVGTPAGTPMRGTGIAVGADGNLWFARHQPVRFGRITTTGVVTESVATRPCSLPGRAPPACRRAPAGFGSRSWRRGRAGAPSTTRTWTTCRSPWTSDARYVDAARRRRGRAPTVGPSVEVRGRLPGRVCS